MIINITAKQILAATSSCFRRNLESLPAMTSPFSPSLKLRPDHKTRSDVFCRQGLGKQAVSSRTKASPYHSSLPRGCCASTQIGGPYLSSSDTTLAGNTRLPHIGTPRVPFGQSIPGQHLQENLLQAPQEQNDCLTPRSLGNKQKTICTS